MRRERPGRASDGICKKEKETAHLSEGARFLYGAGETGGGRWAGDTEGNVGRLPRPAWGRCPQTPAIFRFAEKGKPWTRALGEVAPKVTERVKRFYANILICHSENPGKILCSAQDDEEGRLKRFVIPSQTALPPAPPEGEPFKIRSFSKVKGECRKSDISPVFHINFRPRPQSFFLSLTSVGSDTRPRI